MLNNKRKMVFVTTPESGIPLDINAKMASKINSVGSLLIIRSGHPSALIVRGFMQFLLRCPDPYLLRFFNYC